jgi:hypothetical protein
MAIMERAQIATVVVYVVCCVACSQRVKKQPPGVLIRESRHLVAAEVVQVLEGSRQAIAGKALRLAESPGQTAPEMIMGTNGRPRVLSETSGFEGSSWNGRGSPTTPLERTNVHVIHITEYTGRVARRCDGRVGAGELVVDYEHRTPPDQWYINARTRSQYDFAAPAFDILAGVTPVESGEIRTIDGHTARAFVGPWHAPRDAIYVPSIPRSAAQSLWIDVESLLPVRWSIAIPTGPGIGGATTPNSLAFLYDDSLDIHTPEGVTAPDCVP